VEGIEAAQNYVCVHAGQTKHLLHVAMNTLENSLDSECFVRIHRSYIVNLRYIKRPWSLPHRQYILELASGERLPSGRTYREKIRTLTVNSFQAAGAGDLSLDAMQGPKQRLDREAETVVGVSRPGGLWHIALIPGNRDEYAALGGGPVVSDQ
jgi:LytTr DNA-binding domain